MGGDEEVKARTAPLIKSKKTRAECAFEARLLTAKIRGEIAWYEYECLRLRIGAEGAACWYTPDYMALNADGFIMCYEVKGGYKWEDSVIKFKAAERLYPMFIFEMWEDKGQGFKKIHGREHV
jgi:hypothetical protein